MLKIYEKICKAYKKGFVYTFLKVFWCLNFYFLRFFKVNKVYSRYKIKLYSDFDDSTFKSYFLAGYGFFYSNFLKNYSCKFVFIDVGANKGLYSILAAQNPCCEKVIAFEPILSTYKHLKKNFWLNNINDKFELYNFAISDSVGDKEIYFDRDHTGKASLRKDHSDENASVVKIQTINRIFLNDLISSEIKNIIVKIDVEGFEFTVLNEMFKCEFSKSITNIFYEVDERWEKPFLIEKILKNNGFSTFKKCGEGYHYDVMATK